MNWDERALAVRTFNGDAAPATMAIAAPGIKVNVTLRVVPATEPALTMVRFKPLSEKQSFEARVTDEVAKRLNPARHRLEQAERRFERAQGQLEAARQRLGMLTRRRSRSLMIALQLATGSAIVRESGTSELAKVGSRSVAAGASFGARHWLDLGGELTADRALACANGMRACTLGRRGAAHRGRRRARSGRSAAGGRPGDCTRHSW